jgi:hypothetical protein
VREARLTATGVQLANWVSETSTDTGKRDEAKLCEVAMKTKYILMPVLALIILITCMSGCLSTNPSGGQGNSANAVPVYQPSVKTASVDTREGNVTTYQTTGSATQVADFYNTEMVNRGYQASTSFQTSPGSRGSDVVLTFVKGTSTVHVAIATVKAQIGPLNLSQSGATTFVITERSA